MTVNCSSNKIGHNGNHNKILRRFLVKGYANGVRPKSLSETYIRNYNSIDFKLGLQIDFIDLEYNVYVNHKSNMHIF